MAMKFHVSFYILLLCSPLSFVDSQCSKKRFPTNIKWGGRFQMLKSHYLGGATPSLVFMKLPRKSVQTRLRAPSGTFYFRSKNDKCIEPDRNLVCPVNGKQCLDGQIPCDHDYHPPSYPPSKSAILEFPRINSSSVTVTWREWNESTDLGYGPVAAYKLEYRQEGGRFHEIRLDKEITSHQVNELASGTLYEFRLVVATDGIFSGYGPPTGIYRKRIPCGVPSNPVLTVNSTTANSAIFHVQVSSVSDWSCEGAVMYIEKLDNERWTNQTWNISYTKIVQNELKSCTTYTYRISILADGDSVASNEVTFTSRASVPTALSLGISSQNDSSAILNVAVPRHEDWSCANRTIRLHRREMNSATWELRKTFHTIPTLIPETGLRACTTYQYQVNITASIGENSMHSEGSDVQSGLTEIGSEVLNVTTIADITRLDVTDVKVSPSKSASGEEGFTVTLPPLTQKYATNYVIVCSISGGNSSTHHNLGVLNKSDVEITFSLNAGNLTQMIRNTQYSRNPNIFVGVKSNCGENTTIVWSEAIEIPVRLSPNDLFVITIVSCVTIAVIILLSAFTSIMAYRCSQDGWNYKRAEVDRDGSDYHALEKRQTSSLDRYMPLKIKAPPEKKLTSVTSLSKLTGNSPAEDGEGEPYSKTLDLILFGQSLVENGSQEISIDPSESNGNVEKEDTDVRSSQSDITSSANVLVNGLMPETADNMQHSKMVTRSNDVTTREGSLADVRHLTAGNKAVVQKAVAKFKSAMPQVYSSEIYDQSSTAEIMNSQSVKNRDHSEDINGLNSSVSCGNMITQSYDKVIVTNESQTVKMRKKVTLSKGDLRNHRLSCSYIEPDEETCCAEQRNKPDVGTLSTTSMGKSGGTQRGSYIDVNEVGTPQYISPGLLGTPSTNKENIERAGTAYMKVFEPLLNKDRDLPLPPINPTQTTTSYMEIKEQGRADDNSLQTQLLGPTYLIPDVERVKMEQNGTISIPKAAYIELDEEGMTRDRVNTMNSAKASYIALDEDAMTRDSEGTMNGAKASYIALDEEAMTRDSVDRVNVAKASYIALDEEAMTKDREETMNAAKASYTEVDAEAMKRDREDMVNSTKSSYIVLDEEAMTRDNDDTMNDAKASYSMVDEEAMTEDTFSKAPLTVDEDAKTRDKNASLTTSKEGYTDIEKEGINALASFKDTSNYARDLNTEESYDEADTQENIYAGVIDDETFANEGNSMIGTTKLEAETYEATDVVNTRKYERTGSFGLKDDIFDKNIVDDSSMFNGNLRQPETGLHQPGGSSYDESIFTSCNDANENGKEDIYFSADENIELPSFSGGTDHRQIKYNTVDEDTYDETSVPEKAHKNYKDESQSIYEEIPAERAKFRKQKESSILQNFKNKVSRSGAMKGTRRSPLPAIPSGHTGPHTRKQQRDPFTFLPIVESSQSDGTYEELPVLKASSNK